MNDERVLSAISLFNEQIRELQDQLKKKQRLVNELCEEAGQPKQYRVEEDSDGTLRVSPGEFFTKPLATVVTAILARRKQAGLDGPALLEEIYALMIKGGFVFDAKSETTARRSLAITLAKNTKFVKLSSNHIALAEWYDLPKQRNKDGDKKPESDAGESASQAVSQDEGLDEFRAQFDQSGVEANQDKLGKKRAKSNGGKEPGAASVPSVA